MHTDHATRALPRPSRTAIVLAVATGLAVLATLALTARTAQARPQSGQGAVVVKVVTRGSFGKMLATTKGLSLYVLPTGTCTGSCLSAWPPLLMPAGKTVPKGITGLSTRKFPGGRLQVAYHKMRLYTFVGDSGKSVNGNGVDGFAVAEVMPAG